MTVKQYVLLCTASTLLPFTREARRQGKPAYQITGHPIGHIICADGTEVSVQAHKYCHAMFGDAEPSSPLYSSNIGEELLACETDSLELDQYGIDEIDVIQRMIDKHGGIDVDATISNLINIVK